MILDTSFLLDLKDGDDAAFERATALYDKGIVQRVAMPSVWELHYGAAYIDSADERRRIRNLLLMYPQADIDQEMARSGAELLAKADREADGASAVDTEDGLIGAVAERYDEPVLTDNVDDFDRLGVEYETY
ncbi:PIN domain-containing protein [Haloarcula salinisoli]|uniref:PIN domain-containing protein n=1 Tax=Haloarcula salinisoli TaxID=2487746 RepID=A0A8J7YGV5_9EURY|nr:PIN domain-containing protein [Halomicroarcula salinisoli]MBX0285713.1 PIN domain-containing protein [Halomicroarcula salinisoli]MBX0302799.1 PIN domain-containing protein [Halomicroarcula salinisoli]